MNIEIHIPWSTINWALPIAVAFGIVWYNGPATNGDSVAAELIEKPAEIEAQEIPTPAYHDDTARTLPSPIPPTASDASYFPVQPSIPSSQSPVPSPPPGTPPPDGGRNDEGAADYAIDRQNAEDRVREARSQQEFLKRREAILRYQLEVLQQERGAMGANVDPSIEEEFRASTRLLVSLIEDQRKGEQFLLSALNQIWEAEGRATVLGSGEDGENGTFRGLAVWPAEPSIGISAFFRDKGYKERFGFMHQGIDIPILQGMEVFATADGVVQDVTDHGLGFNSLTILHEGGAVTLYGHLSKFLVQKGARVYAGDVIGLSGGRPGTRGAGFSTGPHLHFELHMNGKAVDPIAHLPAKDIFAYGEGPQEAVPAEERGRDY